MDYRIHLAAAALAAALLLTPGTGRADDPPDVDEAAETEGSSMEDTPEAEASRPPEPLPWRNSFFSWTNAVTTRTFAPDAQLSYDPTYVMTFSLIPRFYLGPRTFLWASQQMFLELTDVNIGALNREPLLSDTLVDLRHIEVVEGFVIQGQARIGLPVSKASQAAGRYLQTGVGLTVTRPFPELAGFTVSMTGAYRRWWASRNVAGTNVSYYGQCGQPVAGEAPLCDQASGVTTARDILLGGLTLVLVPVGSLSISLTGFYVGMRAHDIADDPVVGDQPDPGHWRAFTYLGLNVAYDITGWFNLGLGIQNSGGLSPLYGQDGNVRSPFNPDTQIFLTATVGLDALYGEIVGGSEDDLTPEERQRRRQGLAQVGGGGAM